MIDYRILGPLEISVDGQEIDISGPKLRTLLVILLLRADESVPRDLLAHELWGERQPEGCQHTLEVYISRLRKALGTPASGRVLVTRPGAYSLRLAGGQLDARFFERLAKEGRSALAGNAPDQAAVKLHAALQLWRGRALADLGDSTELRIEAARLEELRLGATEDRIEADLALAVATGPADGSDPPGTTSFGQPSESAYSPWAFDSCRSGSCRGHRRRTALRCRLDASRATGARRRQRAGGRKYSLGPAHVRHAAHWCARGGEQRRELSLGDRSRRRGGRAH